MTFKPYREAPRAALDKKKKKKKKEKKYIQIKRRKNENKKNDYSFCDMYYNFFDLNRGLCQARHKKFKKQ